MSTCVRKCTFERACNVGVNSLNVVSRTFPHFSQSMLTPMQSSRLADWSLAKTLPLVDSDLPTQAVGFAQFKFPLQLSL